MKSNQRVRDALDVYGVKYWQLAKMMGISDSTLSKKLREELPEKEQDLLIKIIKNPDEAMRFYKVPTVPTVNKEVRQALEDAGLRQWQLAEAMGISDAYLSKKLRKPLDYKERDRLIWIINNRAKYMQMIGITGEK